MSAFVAAGQNGLRLVSADGRRWTTGAVGKEGEVYRAVAFGRGRFAAVGTYGGSNLLAWSADGAAWKNVQKDGQYKNFLRGLAFGGGAFVGIGGDPGAVGDSGPFVVTSADGETWSDYAKISGRHIVRRIAFGDGRWVGVGDRGRRTTSKDAREWTDVPKTKAVDTLIDVAYGAGRFVGVGLHGLRMSSLDGVEWTPRIDGEEGEHLNSIVWAKDRFVAVGTGATYLSPDGLAWTRRENKDAPHVVAYGDGLFVGLQWRGRVLVSADGVAWEEVHKAEHHLEAVAYG
jgi:hypothetical protein